jgi:hypothetical protein
MSAEQFRPIFERFQNLNLIVLLEDLRKGQVARNSWTTKISYKPISIEICPIAHGWSKYISPEVNGKYFFTFPSDRNIKSAEMIGVDVKNIKSFLHWWDSAKSYMEVTQELLQLLQSILDERLADADVVQEVIEEVLV